jgi:hypothetical protein
VFNPNELTGALVKEIRTSHGMSRDAFMKLAELPGRSSARLSNIEHKNSWKPGDRERVAVALTQLVPNFDPRYHGTAVHLQGNGQTVEQPPADPVTVSFADDDPEDNVVDVLPFSAAVVRLPSGEEAHQQAVNEPTTAPRAEPSNDLYSISNSELQTFKRCRRKWWFAYYRRLALRTRAFIGARSVGDRVHRALQHWYVPDGQTRVDPRDALERVVVEDWTEIATLARERNVNETQLAVLAQEFGRATNLERAMVEGYVQWLEETGADADLRITASETALEVPVVVSDDRGHETEIKLIGKLDVRATRTTDDVRLFLDHKTVGDLKGPAVTLPQNEQILHYHLLEFLTTKDAEERCDGALYNMLKRSKRTARALPPFYDRIEVRHNKYELESYRRRAYAASADVVTAIKRLNDGQSHHEVVYPSPKSDCRWDCDFFAVCNLHDDGSAGVDDMINVLYVETDPLARYREEKGKEL